MRIKIRFFTFIFLTVFTAIICPSSADAKRVSLDINGRDPIIYDGADAFNDYEELNILSELSKLYNNDNFIYVVITTPDVNDYTVGHELEGIYNDHNNYFEAIGTVLFLINTDEDNAFCEVQGYNDASSYIPHEICDYINKELSGYITNGEYYNATQELITYLTKVQNNEITLDTVTRETKTGLWYNIKDRLPIILLVLFASFAVSAAATVLIIVSGRRKIHTAKNNTENIKICSRHDIYVRSVINRYRKS